MNKRKTWVHISVFGVFAALAFMAYYFAEFRVRGEARVIPVSLNVDVNARVDEGIRDLLATTRHAIEALPLGSWLLEAPAKMRLGESKQVRLSIAPGEKAHIRAALERSYQTAGGSIRIAPRVSAKLEGPEFDIVPLSEKEQPIAEGTETIWDWVIVAKKTGIGHLFVAVQVPIKSGDHEYPYTVTTLSREITIPVDRVAMVLKFLTTSWEWIAGTLIIPLTVYLWNSRRKRKDANATVVEPN